MKFIGLLLLLTIAARAEYRVFKLHLENSKSGQKREFASTLDPQQYVQIYPIKPEETLTYVQTWLCRGNTGGLKPHCPPPENSSK